jgi:hypothetical protein
MQKLSCRALLYGMAWCDIQLQCRKGLEPIGIRSTGNQRCILTRRW